MSENIEVWVRMRPMTEKEKALNPRESITKETKNSLKVIEEGRRTNGPYSYNGIWGVETQQEEVFEQVQGLLDDIIKGFSVTIFAYGQTGSGKTHSIIGNKEDPGIAPRIIDYLFGWMGSLSMKFSMCMSEIYNEKITDLITQNQGLRVQQRKDGAFEIHGLLHLEVENGEEMKKVLRRGFTNRKIGVNDKHDKSSRSHCIFTLIVSSGTQTGILNLVDLAGSEYASGEGNIGETRHINQSLLSLKKVLKAKVDKKATCPIFRICTN